MYSPLREACQRGQLEGKPLHIRFLKRFAADNSNDHEKEVITVTCYREKMQLLKWPAGLTAAFYLVN